MHSEIIENIIVQSASAEDIAEEKSFAKEELAKVNEISEAKEPLRTGWIPYWDFAEGVKSFETVADTFYSISPVIYEVNETGKLKKYSPKTLPDLISVAEKNNVKVIPTIAEFDWRILNKIFSSTESTNLHINEIVSEVVIKNYDGIDIDYEATQIQDKYLYFQFIEKLAKKLHEKNKLLSICILSQWDIESYPALPETRQVQDLEYLANYADELRIMTYDYSYQGSKEPGPIAPLAWQEAVLQYLIIDKKVPRDKIYLGVHLYGYEWNNNPESIKATPRTYSYIKSNSLKTEYNSSYGENVGTFSCGNFTCTIIHQSKEGIKVREDIAKKYGIRGLAFWRIGREGGLLEN